MSSMKVRLLQALRVHSIGGARSALFNWLARKEKAHLYCALKIQIYRST